MNGRLPILTDPESSFTDPESSFTESTFTESTSASPVSRRTFLEYLGGSLAVAGLAGCKPEVAERIVPFARNPPELTPGVAVGYATSMELDGYGFGLLVQAREGRPIKIEGHPDHPINRGAAGPFEQASLMQLYDPDRARGVVRKRAPSTWHEFVRVFTGEPLPKDGRGIHFLLEPTASPSVAALLDRIRARYPQARLHFHSAFTPRARWDASIALFGRALIPIHHLDQAEVVLSLDADFLTRGPTWLKDAREFAARRDPKQRMSRLYVAECDFSSTGAKADHRIALRSDDLLQLARAVGARFLPGVTAGSSESHRDLIALIAGDLDQHRGSSLVIAGERQPKEIHALAMLLNHALGNVGRTVSYHQDPILEAGEPSHDLSALATELAADRVERLVIAGGNPVYTAPAEIDLERLILRAKQSAYLGQYDDETAAACGFRIAETHFLESWGDVRAADGTLSLVQPLIRPLFGGRTRTQLLSVFAGDPDAEPLDLIRSRYGGPKPIEPRVGDPAAVQDLTFDNVLRSGLLPNTATASVAVAPDASWLAKWSKQEIEQSLELALTPSRAVHDGRFANNPWLQELPDPMTRLCWGNAALLSPRTAARLSLESGDWIRIAAGSLHQEAPVFVQPGLPEESVTLSLGYGREGRERNGDGVGVDAFALRTSAQPWFVPNVAVVKIERRDPELAPVCVQEHSEMLGRTIILSRTLAQFERDPDFAEAFDHEQPTTRAKWPETGHQWGMAIDLSKCVGCNACVIACQAENNVPSVGKVEVSRGHEMHWLRLDRYYLGDSSEAQPEVVHQPMLCQHCEAAPCEYVCPVNATVHSPDGLNEMVYNRCVGTRFCSNNCPYKVRRFNWFDYNDGASKVEALHFNPDVTVRARGVMEKCTYCVQRIRRTGIEAKNERREVGGDEVVTACQQSCPAEAIVFGDINDPKSRVHALHADQRTYAVLHELGTRPRTRYLAAIRNPKDSASESAQRAKRAEMGGPALPDRDPKDSKP